MSEGKNVVDVKGPAEEKPSDSGQIKIEQGNVLPLVVNMLSGVTFQLKRIADAVERMEKAEDGGPERPDAER